MNFTSVLWDLDGTILASGPGIFESFRKTFEALGIDEPSADELRRYLGPPLKVIFEEEVGLDAEMTKLALETYAGFYKSSATSASLFAGVMDLIDTCSSAGLKNSLATSKSMTNVKWLGEHYGFLGHFDFLGTADPEANRLNKTDVITYALAGLKAQGADLSRVILVGDRIQDVEGARNHGIDVALVKWGYGAKDEWAEADYVVEDTQQLKELLLGVQSGPRSGD